MIIKVTNPNNMKSVIFYEFDDYYNNYGALTLFKKMDIAKNEGAFEIISKVNGFYGLQSNEVVTSKSYNQNGLEFLFNNYAEKRYIFRTRVDKHSLEVLNEVFYAKNHTLWVEINDDSQLYSSKDCWVENTYESGDIELVVGSGSLRKGDLENYDTLTENEITFVYSQDNKLPLIPFYLAPFGEDIEIPKNGIWQVDSSGNLAFNLEGNMSLEDFCFNTNNQSMAGDIIFLGYQNTDSIVGYHLKIGTTSNPITDTICFSNIPSGVSIEGFVDIDGNTVFTPPYNINRLFVAALVNQGNYEWELTGYGQSHVGNLDEGDSYASDVTGNTYQIPTNIGKVLLPSLNTQVVELNAEGEAYPFISIEGTFDLLTLTNLNNGTYIKVNDECTISDDGQVTPLNAYVEGSFIFLENGTNKTLVSISIIFSCFSNLSLISFIINTSFVF